MKEWNYVGTEPHLATEPGGAFEGMPTELVDRADRVRIGVRTAARKRGLFQPGTESYEINVREDGLVRIALTVNGVKIERFSPPPTPPISDADAVAATDTEEAVEAVETSTTVADQQLPVHEESAHEESVQEHPIDPVETETFSDNSEQT